MDSIKSTVTLSNGLALPRVGLGVFQVDKEDDLRRSVQAALQAGYIHIDTAAAYENEDMVGRAVREYGNRDNVFITSKLKNDQQAEAEKACKQSLERLGMDHLDLYLIHWP
ncbi:aldo/keto reductase, partial [Ruminococcaceae bacterium OttesenSCG-928-I18]|nr:aldo/keto reductase [Ruminococcaceae bacterium OttesenSCG-928-I18]